MPRSGKQAKQFGSTANHRKLEAQVRSLDQLNLMERLIEEFGPELMKDAAKLSTKEILEKYKKLAALRLAFNTLYEADSGKSTAAATQILDRTEGKATERKEIKHQYEDLTDEQLDSHVASEFAQMMADDEETD